MREVVDELGADSLEAAQLGDVLEHEPHAEDRRAPGSDDQGAGGSAGLTFGERDLAARPACLAGPLGDGLDSMVAEGLDRRPPEHRAGVAAQEHVGRGVGDLDAQVVAEPHDADADEVGQVGEVAQSLLETELGRLGPKPQPPQPIDEVVAPAGRRVRRHGALGLAQRLADLLERAPAGPCVPKRDREHDRLCRHEDHDGDVLHSARIAHAGSGRALTSGQRALRTATLRTDATPPHPPRRALL